MTFGVPFAQNASVAIQLYGRETYVVSHYAPPLINEVQDIVLLGTATNEVQELSVRYNVSVLYEGDVTLSWYDKSSPALHRTVNEYVLGREITALLPADSKAIVRVSVVSSGQPGWVKWRVEIGGMVGDVPLINITCASCDMDGLNAKEATKGVYPVGTFALAASNESDAGVATISASSTVSSLMSSLSSIGISATVTEAPSVTAGSLRTWRVTFEGYAGMRPLLYSNESLHSLSNGGKIRVLRANPGSSVPEGVWQLHLGDAQSAFLSLNASEGEVKAAVETLPGVVGVRVRPPSRTHRHRGWRTVLMCSCWPPSVCGHTGSFYAQHQALYHPLACTTFYLSQKRSIPDLSH